MKKEEALLKVQRYCSYQERCESEVNEKLRELGASEKDFNFILKKLKDENFVDEERFAKTFAQGKFNLKKWGRIKIEWELKAKSVPEKIIHRALQEIDEEEYRKTMESILYSRLESLNEADDFLKKNQAAKFAIGKGFEPDLVWELLKNNSSGI